MDAQSRVRGCCQQTKIITIYIRHRKEAVMGQPEEQGSRRKGKTR
jgi:hypothetical protein